METYSGHNTFLSLSAEVQPVSVSALGAQTGLFLDLEAFAFDSEQPIIVSISHQAMESLTFAEVCTLPAPHVTS